MTALKSVQIPKSIVYAQTKNSACKIYRLLSSSAHNRKSVGLYHADISKSNKTLTHHEFSRADSELKCLVLSVYSCLWIGMCVSSETKTNLIMCQYVGYHTYQPLCCRYLDFIPNFSGFLGISWDHQY